MECGEQTSSTSPCNKSKKRQKKIKVRKNDGLDILLWHKSNEVKAKPCFFSYFFNSTISHTTTITVPHLQSLFWGWTQQHLERQPSVIKDAATYRNQDPQVSPQEVFHAYMKRLQEISALQPKLWVVLSFILFSSSSFVTLQHFCRQDAQDSLRDYTACCEPYIRHTWIWYACSNFTAHIFTVTQWP